MASFDLKAVITAEDKASSTISKVGGAFTSLAKVGIAGAVAGVAALTYELKKSVDAFSESQNVTRQTEAVLKSTGGVAGVTAQRVSELATQFQSMTMFSDETIQSGENLLLTFTGIGQDVFPKATETMLNMSQALGQDVKSSAIQLGKALQDPILGVTALRRVGVNFNEAAQETIKTMVEQGRVAEAQTFILKELEVEFGNSAIAAGETFAGKVTILRNKIGDLQETIGSAVVEAITPFINKLSAWASDPATQQRVAEIAKVMQEKLIKAFNDFKNWYDSGGKETLQGVLKFAEATAKAFLAVADAIGKVMTALTKVGKPSEDAIKRSMEGLSGVSGSKLRTRASGGFLSGGQASVVGERGPEIFVPSSSGRIIPNNQISNAFTVNFYGNINNTDNRSLDDIGKRLARQLELSRLGIS